ncbi:MAG: glycine--tRNA ligase subunit beta [Rhodanobacteraceae bacterium]|nr:MAG: glycine--tRNA ligase subunit beta [Rhodanobacteraceae bacterium]
MSEPKSLLIEIGCEELPIHAVDTLARAFAEGVCGGLARRGVAAGLERARVFAAPRRLAVWVPEVAAAQPEQRSESFGPYVNSALDAQGQPTRALLGFAHKAGVEWTQLERARDARGERFVRRSASPGRRTVELVPEIVREAAAALPIPKPMRWGDHDFAFVRPVHWLVLLLGDEVVAGDLFGVPSGRQSRGHRFMHPAPVHLADADSYVDALRAARVLADPAERRQRIRAEVARVAPADGVPRLDDALLDELANLNEWPVAIACAFEHAYLAVPHEALVTTMRANQKFVPVFDAGGRLTEHFIGIANLESRDPAQVRHGYERVIRPRFADAKYFFDADLKSPLADYQPALREVTYQKALGSVWDKTERVAALAAGIAQRLKVQQVAVDAAAIKRAAELSRCDLLTRMVGEFPELQGVAGRHYAAAQGEPAAVATALDSFYAPRQSGDAIAADRVGQVLAIADRLDTLAGGFAAGLKPTGNKDPFALRRAAQGLARTLIEAGLELDLDGLLQDALARVPEAACATPAKGAKAAPPTGVALDAAARRVALLPMLRDFVLERLRGYYAERGFTAQQFAAVAAVRPASLVDFDRRLHAVRTFAEQPAALHLAAANKRVANILRKEGIDVAVTAQRGLDPALLREPAEQALAQALEAARSDNAPRLEGAAGLRDYAGALVRLAQLQAPVDAFFDAVMVMAEDRALRANRVALLARIKARFDAVADISVL